MIYFFIGLVCLALIVLAVVVNATNDLGLEVQPQQLKKSLTDDQYIAMCMRQARPTSLTMQAADPEYTSES